MSVRILTGDCRTVLRDLPDESVHCVVTSPPYFGLRDYQTDTWVGGDDRCKHSPAETRGNRGLGSSTLVGGKDCTAHAQDGYKNVCARCGAIRIRKQMGLESSPEEYVDAVVSVFREVRRVLRSDGVCWLNLGDSYASGGGTGTQGGRGQRFDRRHTQETLGNQRQWVDLGIKPKDLIGIPWMVAFALRRDGWYLRQDVIWAKSNPMPESVGDRCTKSHEYLFLLSKSPRYFYDAEAIAEPLGEASVVRLAQPNLEHQAGSIGPGKSNGPMKAVGRRAPGNRTHKQAQAYAAGDERLRTKAGLIDFAERERAKVEAGDLTGTRNKRSVWRIASEPFPGAHFATFPTRLIEPCILAGTSAYGSCARCGAPWRRKSAHGGGQRGWEPTCKCGADVAPCRVLDPFGGAGTTGLVADRLGRDAVLVELNPDYVAMASNRIVKEAPLVAKVSVA